MAFWGESELLFEWVNDWAEILQKHSAKIEQKHSGSLFGGQNLKTNRFCLNIWYNQKVA